MSHTFKIGDPAVIDKPGHSMHGVECVVIGGLMLRFVRSVDTGTCYERDAYLVTMPGYTEFAVPPRYLRKRRPPQDWVKLCNLNDIPREMVNG